PATNRTQNPQSQKSKVKSQKAKGKSQKAKGKRQKAKGKNKGHPYGGYCVGPLRGPNKKITSKNN
ncbi:MAG: hypothetical protein LIP03_13175, partial [Bacteroidales bacterium]|nr:hypothetical protein [Bacteroidales bacterium]